MKDQTVGEFLERYKNTYEMLFVDEHETLLSILDHMIEHNEERVVYVLNDLKQLTGIISVGRLARYIFHEEISPAGGFSPSSSILHYLTVEHAKDIMDKEILYCTKQESIDSVLTKMLASNVKKSVPVVDEKMHVIDSINIINLMGLYAQEKSSD